VKKKLLVGGGRPIKEVLRQATYLEASKVAAGTGEKLSVKTDVWGNSGNASTSSRGQRVKTIVMLAVRDSQSPRDCRQGHAKDVISNRDRKEDSTAGGRARAKKFPAPLSSSLLLYEKLRVAD
jgi:uncharacterized protein YyaL (SSP411 family)